MAETLSSLSGSVLRRLSDLAGAYWSREEIDDYVRRRYRELALRTRAFADWTYLENLPAGFTHTADWEEAYGTFRYGVANFTYEQERRRMTEDDRLGPANHTSPFEATGGYLSRAAASTAIPATAEMPATVTEIERALWDARTIDAATILDVQLRDSRYHLTEGEVFAYTWQQDGVRTFRKIRIPAAQADTYTVTGSWGAVRSLGDVTSTSLSGTWGIPRRIPGQHPLGADRFGAPRRFYRDGTNVRVEHWREGRALTSSADVCELPDRYAAYLRDGAVALALARNGDGQQLRLAAHYGQRWERGIARLVARRRRLVAARVGMLGGGATRPRRNGPPRPRLPWQFGQEMR